MMKNTDSHIPPKPNPYFDYYVVFTMIAVCSIGCFLLCCLFYYRFEYHKLGDIIVRTDQLTGAVKDITPIQTNLSHSKNELGKVESYGKRYRHNSRLQVWTTWIDGHMYYQFRIDELSKQIKSLNKSTSKATYVIQFLTGERTGISVQEVHVQFNTLTSLYDSYKSLNGYEATGKIQMSEQVYRSINGWSVSWKGFPEPKQ